MKISYLNKTKSKSEKNNKLDLIKRIKNSGNKVQIKKIKTLIQMTTFILLLKNQNYKIKIL